MLLKTKPNCFSSIMLKVVYFFTVDYENARIHLKKAEETSDLNSDTEATPIQGKKRRVAQRKLDYDAEGDDEEEPVPVKRPQGIGNIKIKKISQ